MFSSICFLVVLVVINQVNGGRLLLPSVNTDCTLQYGDRLLKEGEKVMVNEKLYKIEDCHLQRAYQTCGTHLWFMINIVCQAIDTQKQKQKQNRLNYSRRFAEEKLLSDACCDHACTVNEMTRYCPN